MWCSAFDDSLKRSRIAHSAHTIKSCHLQTIFEVRNIPEFKKAASIKLEVAVFRMQLFNEKIYLRISDQHQM